MNMQALPERTKAHVDAAHLLFTFWLAIAIFLTVFYRLVSAPNPYQYGHAWGSSDTATMARSFANYGIFALGGVPVNNNPPLGLNPSAYTHWPPLLPMILSGGFRILGESEATAHWLMLAIALASAFLLYWIANLCLGRTAACLAAFCWLTLPAVVSWGHLLTPESPAILFVLAALLAFLKATDSAGIRWGWAVPGGVAVALAAWSSWEGVLLAPGLLAAALWNRKPSERRLAVIYGTVALTATIGLVACYAIRYPSLMLDTFQTAKFRMGLSSTYSSLLLHRNSAEDRMTLPGIVMNVARHHWQEIGLLGLGATAWVVFSGLEARRRQKGGAIVVVFCGLLSPWFLWSAIMPNHVANHDFEMLIAAPAVAMSLAWGGREALGALARSEQGRLRLRSLAILLVVPLLMLEPFGEALGNLEFHRGTGWKNFLPSAKLRRELAQPDDLVRFANEIREASGPDAVILSPVESMVPVYYSRRHIVRVIENDDLLEQAIPQAAAAFPESPLYLALQPTPAQKSHFPRALARYTALRITPDLILLDLDQSQASRDDGQTGSSAKIR